MTAKSSMKAAVLYKAKDLRFETVQRPTPGPGQCLIKIRANGLCGSDIHFFEDGKLGPFRVNEPYIPGHEACGTIEELGPGVTQLAVGERVVIEPGIPCRKCEYCHSGMYNLCPNVVFLSAPPVNGTFAEYAVVDSDFLYPVPAGLSDEEAALVEPVSVGVHACNRASIRPGSSAVVIGSGPIGLITLLVAKAYGATNVIMVDVIDSRLEKALEIGAHAVVNPKKVDVVKTVFDLTHQKGADFVFEASGSSAGASLSPRVASRGGTVTLIGWPEVSEFPFPIEMVIEKELNIGGVNRYRNTFGPALSLMVDGKIPVKQLISQRFDFSEVVPAFKFASENKALTTKVVIIN